MMTTRLVSADTYQTFWRGKPTRYAILKSATLSMHGIANIEETGVLWLGSFAACRKLVALWLRKEEEATPTPLAAKPLAEVKPTEPKKGKK